MKNIKRISVVCLLFITVFILAGCEFTSSDFSLICDENNENCEEYDYDYDEGSTKNDNGNGDIESPTTPSPTNPTTPSPSDPTTPAPAPAPSTPTTSSSNGKTIADYARSLYTSRNKEFKYISPSAAGADKARINTYNDVKTDGYLKTDCNGFVGYVLHHALGIGVSKATKISHVKFAYPSGSTWKSNNSHVKVIAKNLSLSDALSKAQVGDLLASNGESTHIQIYVGNGQVIDNTLSGAGSIALRGKGASRSILHKNDKFTILRVE